MIPMSTTIIINTFLSDLRGEYTTFLKTFIKEIREGEEGWDRRRRREGRRDRRKERGEEGRKGRREGSRNGRK